MATYQQFVVMFEKDGYNTEESHHDGEVRFVHGRWGRGSRGTRSVLETRGEQLDHQRAHPLFEKEAEFWML